MSKGYYHTKASVKEYIQLAKDVDSRQLIEKLRKYLKQDSEVLELGSGPGTDWKILSEYFQVIGSDNSSQFLNHLKQCNPNGQFLALNAIDIETEREFDCIYSNKVLHHLNDQELLRSVQRQAQIIKSNGMICHSFWKGEGNEVFKGLFVNYHSERTLTTAFDEHFEILALQSYNEFDDSDSLLLIAKKKLD